LIHYNVWFSLRDGAAEADQMQLVRAFLADLKSRRQIYDFQLLKNRAAPGNTRLGPFHALIMFRDNDQFGPPFTEVAAIGIHSGRHGFMIENVTDFVVEVFEELPYSPALS
jgi:hypothetical protein